MSHHTILLVQRIKDPTSRSYGDYDTLDECFTHFVHTFQKEKQCLKYSEDEIIDFIDGLFDISCLILQPMTKTYATFDRNWIREKLSHFLRRSMPRSSNADRQWPQHDDVILVQATVKEEKEADDEVQVIEPSSAHLKPKEEPMDHSTLNEDDGDDDEVQILE